MININNLKSSFYSVCCSRLNQTCGGDCRGEVQWVEVGMTWAEVDNKITCTTHSPPRASRKKEAKNPFKTWPLSTCCTACWWQTLNFHVFSQGFLFDRLVSTQWQLGEMPPSGIHVSAGVIDCVLVLTGVEVFGFGQFNGGTRLFLKLNDGLATLANYRAGRIAGDQHLQEVLTLLWGRDTQKGERANVMNSVHTYRWPHPPVTSAHTEHKTLPAHWGRCQEEKRCLHLERFSGFLRPVACPESCPRFHME